MIQTRFLSKYSVSIKRLLSTVNVWNEWDQLEEVIVGSPLNAAIPPLDEEVKICINPTKWDFFIKNSGKLWSDILGTKYWDNILEEHSNFVETLQKEGIIVRQPQPQDFTEKFIINGYKTSGFYCAMPRDILFTIGDEIIEAPMTWRSRYFEYRSYRQLIMDHYWTQGHCKWTTAPKPTYNNLFTQRGQNNDNDLLDYFITNESEPTFDSADFIKCGRDVFAQRSQVTNIAGIEWMRDHLLRNHGVRVHQLQFNDARPMHVDASLLPLKPGLFLGNPDRKCKQANRLKQAGWDIIYASPRPNAHNSQYYLSSPWITMNILSLNQHTVIAEAQDTQMQQMLSSLNINVIPVKFRHCNSIGGGFHCWSADIRRQHGADLNQLDYFDWSHTI